MKKIINLTFLFCIIFFAFSCSKNDSGVKLNKYLGRYEGTLNTTANTKQLVTNKGTLIVNEDDSINIKIEGGNIYDDNVTIVKEELTQVTDNSYQTEKNGKKYTFTFNDTYMTLKIENTDNTVSEGKLSKIG